MATPDIGLISISQLVSESTNLKPKSSINSDPAVETSPIHSPNSDSTSVSEPVCCSWIPWTCLQCEKRLIKFKSFFFFFGGAIGCIFPYFSVFYKQIGFSPNQIGVIAGVRPILGFVSGPLWGSLADRFRIRRIMLCLSALGWLIFLTTIGFVPSPKRSDEQCSYVAEYLGTPYNGTEPSGPYGDDLQDYFRDLHKPKPDISPQDNLMESRGWVYDRDDLNRVHGLLITILFGLF